MKIRFLSGYKDFYKNTRRLQEKHFVIETIMELILNYIPNHTIIN